MNVCIIIFLSITYSVTKNLPADVYEPFKNQIRAVPTVVTPLIAPIANSMAESMIKKANLNKRPGGSSKSSKVI